MPLFRGKSEEEKQREAAAQARRHEQEEQQQVSLEALKLGGIPVQAQRRLDELRQSPSKLFTSDLSVDEFVLARQAGLRPLSQVMGSSIYHVGWQSTPGQYMRFASSQELSVISQAMNTARLLALGRMAEEAERVGANAVVGVRITRGRYDWAGDLIEFSALGTAVRVEGVPPSERPALTNLSGQDFWKLYRSGYWPLGVVAGSTVFYVVASWQTQMANSAFGRWYNMELQDFTLGLQRARHIAMGQVYSHAQELGAEGVVGMAIEQSHEEHEVSLGNDQERTDLIATFHAIGTAIRQLTEQTALPPIQAVVNLKQ